MTVEPTTSGSVFVTMPIEIMVKVFEATVLSDESRVGKERHPKRILDVVDMSCLLLTNKTVALKIQGNYTARLSPQLTTRIAALKPATTFIEVKEFLYRLDSGWARFRNERMCIDCCKYRSTSEQRYLQRLDEANATSNSCLDDVKNKFTDLTRAYTPAIDLWVNGVKVFHKYLDWYCMLGIGEVELGFQYLRCPDCTIRAHAAMFGGKTESRYYEVIEQRRVFEQEREIRRERKERRGRRTW